MTENDYLVSGACCNLLLYCKLDIIPSLAPQLANHFSFSLSLRQQGIMPKKVPILGVFYS